MIERMNIVKNMERIESVKRMDMVESAERMERIRGLVLARCKDDGEAFVDASRLVCIDRLLEGSEWMCVAEGRLMRLYSQRALQAEDCVIVVSSHVDCVYESLCFEMLPSDDAAELTARGTWDNALTNAAVVELMLSGRLPQNVVVAFTGDEEVKSRGAQEVVGALSEADCYVRFVVVTDVTNVGWEHGLAFTIENDLNVDILTAHSIVEGMKGYAGRYGFVHEALPDESWIYDEYKLPCLTLCHPVGGDMHSDEGALARLSAFPVYCDALADLCKILAELTH